MTSEPTKVELSEYESTTRELSQHDVRDLLTHAGQALEITPTTTAGEFRLKANSRVGVVAAGRFEVLIRPKIPLDNVFLLLEPVHAPIDLRSDVVGFGTYDELTPAFAAFYARMLERTLMRGMRRSYVAIEEDLVTLRGRIDLPRQARSPIATPLACQYEEYSLDTPHNRLLKAAAHRLLLLPAIGEANRNTLRHLLMWFGEVGDRPPAVDRVLSKGFTRLDAHYEPAVRLAALVLENSSLREALGEVTASAFLIDMNRVFEGFLESRLRAALSPGIDVRGQAPTYLDPERQVRMKPDLVFKHRNRTVYVGDAKYKITSDITGVDSDLYQLLAYVTALGVSEGVLIYAQTDESAPPTAVNVPLADKTLAVRRIDLRGNSTRISQAIDELAAWIRERIAAGARLKARSGTDAAA